MTVSLLFEGIIFYIYYKENKDHLEENILFRMRDYTFDFKSKDFKLIVLKKQKNVSFFKTFDCDGALCSYFRFPNDDNYILKVIYPKDKFKHDVDTLFFSTLKLVFIGFIIILILSFLFALYSIKPMKNALMLLEVFLKDLIHDLNTPVTSILVNVKLLEKSRKSKELERIKLSANMIAMLYKNLEVLKNSHVLLEEVVDIRKIIEEKIEMMQKIYPKIRFKNNLKPLHVNIDKNIISRILDNIITNACKYNIKNGEVFFSIENKTILIEDTGVGIKNPQRIFDRYYKENERGLGIGMNIVKRLCDELNIDITVTSKINIGTKVKLTIN